MTLALYRTYRPGTLAEVIGQDHITGPMARALDSGRTHHAYLLSGPRGCGKTSTARILARSMNCVEGPSATPCGQCQSCLDLAPNGPGSIDVVELDAATHRGIDDARDLREKAIFAPAVGEYRVYIIDEAHQLTKEAANALLKLIEEPPPHLRFIFATTEADKILPTIRSRTFHYGFRLVPAPVLAEHLASVCRSEGTPAEPAALAAVARAGAGSVRDSLSVLGQLLSGAGPDGLTYAEAVATLGLTDDSLLEAFVLALSQGSVAQMFQVVDRVISAGHDPRRFAADLLDRLRDLLIVRVDAGALTNGVIEVADDAGERLVAQAHSLGQAELSRAADLVNAGLSELKGATAPRLQLELLCARLALAPAQGDAGALLARLERLERQVAAGSGAQTAAAAVGAGTPPAASAGSSPASAQVSTLDPREARVTGTPTSTSDPPAGRATVDAPESAETAPPTSTRPTGPAVDPMPATSASAGRPAPAGATPPRRPQLRSGRSTTQPAPAGSQPADPADADPVRPATSSPSTQSASVQRGQAAPAGSRPSGAVGPGSATGAGVSAAPVSAGNPPVEEVGAVTLDRVREGWESILEALFQASRVAWTAFGGARPLSLQDRVLAVGLPEAGAVRAITMRGHDERLRQVLIDVLGLDVSIDVMHEGRTAPPAAASASSVGTSGLSTTGRSGSSAGRAKGAGQPGETGPAPAHSRAAAVGLAVPLGGAPEPAAPDEPSEDGPDLVGADDSFALIERELGARTIGEIDHA